MHVSRRGEPADGRAGRDGGSTSMLFTERSAGPLSVELGPFPAGPYGGVDVGGDCSERTHCRLVLIPQRKEGDRDEPAGVGEPAQSSMC